MSPSYSSRSLRYWTVAVTSWREEWRAAHHVENLGLKYYLPMTYDESRRDERKVLLFPGFIFVKLGSGWQELSTTKGIFCLLLMPISDDEMIPARVLPTELERLRRMEDSDGVVRLTQKFRSGDSVVIDETLGGAFGGVSGVVRGSSRGRVSVALRMLGKMVSREFSASVLHPIAA